MAGELWNSEVRIGRETTYGTAPGSLTRKLYLRDPVFTRERTPRPQRFATGTRDNQRAHTLGPVMAGGRASMAVSGDELIEFLLLGMSNAPVITSPSGGGSLWTFKPGTTFDSATLEMHDGARWEREVGVRVNTMRFSGSAQQENAVTVDLFGSDLNLIGPSTFSGSDRVPTFIEGWETTLATDLFGSTTFASLTAGTLISWDITFNNNLGRKYTADNANKASGVVLGVLDISATLVYEAAASAAAVEFANWDAQTKREVRLTFGKNALIPTTTNQYFVDITLPGAWSAVNLGGNDAGTRTYELGLNYVYDSTSLLAGAMVRCQTLRATAY